jgi:cytochrome c-type biogenesis protein CcmH
MWIFLLVAAVMAVIAAAAVAVPLLRDRRSRVQGALAALAVLGVAAGLYPLWSTWDWNAPPGGVPGGPDVAAMVAKLEKHLVEQPGDLDGWLMLGRSYTALGRVDEAIVAYDHAHRLNDGKNVEATIGLGEALSIKADGEVTPQAAQLFEQAIAAAPDNPRALLFGGFAAAVMGDRPLARRRWEALKALNPPPQVMQMLDARIAELGAPAAGMGAAAAAGSSAPGTAMSAPGAAPQFGARGAQDGAAAGAAAGAPDPPGLVTVNITIAAALKGRLTAAAPLFVFARDATPGPPLAAKRLSVAAIGTRVELSSADSMMPTHALAGGQHVSITARVSFSGQPTPVTGDLYGEISYDVGRDGVRDLVIDRIAP